jgi:hypothetical protein
MFSITKSRSPRPKLRVTWRSCAASAPHRSHRIIFFNPSRDDDDRPGRTDLDDRARRLAVERLAADDVLAFPSLRIALSFDDFASEDDVLDVEDAASR